MNLLLILRSESVCLVVLLFVVWYAKKYILDEDKRFFWILFFAIGHVALDFITVVTVNRQHTVPAPVNFALHISFYLFAILYCYELLRYVMDLVYPPDEARRNARIAAALPVIYAAAVPFQPIEYPSGMGTDYSFGPSVVMGYAMAVFMFFLSEALILRYRKRIPGNVKRALAPGFILMSLAVVAQALVPELLFTGAAGTLMTICMFFAVVNPAGKYRHKAYFDLDAEIKNRNCYTDDIRRLGAELGTEAAKRGFICVQCDLNGLKEINDTYGHETGDAYIRAVAKRLQEALPTAYGVYRVGGDEFQAIYIDCDQAAALSEIDAARRLCNNGSVLDGLPMNVAIGVAEAAEGEDVCAVIRRADQQMYHDKCAFYENSAGEARRSAAH